ncbi:hypothetical protein A2761_02965 [Candidatus Kaiserbacteria bacterium RIFCSPHIGHO2_01_FULL_51_33]|uniref:Ribonuclease n=1 Tax=Candidatus Kaiserbacteria bacterium RIFCSPLOWO2_01_FULL_51_21 TaxID=1798508 RepID=A0A1F6ECC9_9BACT|nr:MAG: hypothetical protein A2761_02965 [Candidatus Kaiserbacteria bacterium RIFCSPHIGHO2_01_FULL_51_33]OGG71334.1 MAG: hypothetical protein A3A35_02255 [Candidatus Kaiserbacteria bacterium RIFCSPLOWO2_01_FULL_51_21]
MPRIKYIIGIDEAGRGPLAGAVSVGVVRIPAKFEWSDWKGVRDSKKLTPHTREKWFERMVEAEQGGTLSYAVAFSSSTRIDRFGISSAVRDAIRRGLLKINADPLESLVLLDGLLKAPRHYPFQKTIIRGDDLEPVISLASIAAKVMRDRQMVRLSQKYPQYGFERHKGYPTKEHYARIRKEGLCDIHRRSFLSSLGLSVFS